MIVGRRIRVLIVDDKAAARQALKDILEADPEFEVLATASDPWVAADRFRKGVPDVMTLELELPRPDGVQVVNQLAHAHPIAVVVCSNRTIAQSRSAIAALDHGAAAFVDKPQACSPCEWTPATIPIREAVRAAARARVRRIPSGSSVAALAGPRLRAAAPRAANLASASASSAGPKLSATAMLPVLEHGPELAATEHVIAIGASTGGTQALLSVLRAMPADAPGIVIVQHMPERFTGQFAQRLDAHCAITVREAVSGDPVERGVALIAPGNRHLLLRRAGERYTVEVKEGPLVNRHRPSVDVLFRSAARAAGRNAIGVILTGMGDDGARGMLELKQAGAHTVAQDEATCVVFGMPAEAIKRGGVDRVLPLDRIVGEVVPRRR